MPVPSSEKSESQLRLRNSQAFLKGTSSGMRAVEEMIQELSQSDVPVLLLAENGAGKQTVARRIHAASRRSSREFRLIECKDLRPENLDGADGNILACPGTVYLDEIACLSPAAQLRLTEALVRLEQAESKRVHGRLICGSARNLDGEARSGQFHEDLYYRISGLCLRLPPLRHRKQDLALFMDFFLGKFAQEFGRPTPLLSERTRQLFSEYDWPGNVQELADAAKAIVVLGNESLAMDGLRAMLRKSDRDHSGQESLKDATRAAAREAEKDLILKALTRTRWNRRRAAQELKISYKALLYKLKQIGCTQSEAS
ncbi:MAG TPA: sigma 54-interacting transcriptional regulator [Terriglobales bacterium]|nr:sigma 54-interacting transcriptional regulator [Terriglobales bacterium]